MEKIDVERSGAFQEANISLVASCRANEICYDGPDGGEFTINLLRPLRSHPVYTNDITLRDHRRVPVISTQPVSSGSLLTDLNTSCYQRICRNVQDCCNMCYKCLFVIPCECCFNCCYEITNCFKNFCIGIKDAIVQSLNDNRFFISFLCFLICPCIALFLAFYCWTQNSKACKAWYCGCCYSEDDDQNETPNQQL